ncbi:NAD-dependent epimerase/dehydratase family protein [Devosia sediminis]|uniref:NAD-dependent epimerase/dehydratase family protein n=1 Tax=Devosia sediminis TaxID=2798801 RepID=A0A934J2V2_9HYPH|nr:NAD-dependent epimerase/dehydratase family protein [Devosia sediminis]MBJ3786837.1 NAD-dependent epimerase/dehydratase family protein [Devosia sediminis]
MARVLVLGGDGFCGWPTALHLSAHGYEVGIVDNFSRRRIDAELGTQGLTPIASMADRLAAWKAVSGQDIEFFEVDVARDYRDLLAVIDTFMPGTIVHFAEQRAAPYSMSTPERKCYTVNNNVSGTHNLLVALVEARRDIHLVHLGTMGVYGYDAAGLEIPEGYLPVVVKGPDGTEHDRSILFPTAPGSVYHMTKSLDQLLFQFYARNDELRITDLHQGIVWGTQTKETRRDDALINRFDYDGDYGTVLNRFLMQAVVDHALTVHGTGGQTRAFIHIQDTVNCVRLAIDNPPQRGSQVKILNQIAETRQVRELAQLVATMTGAEIAFVDNPRKEAPENTLRASNATFRALGLEPIRLDDRLLEETMEIAQRFKGRYNPAIVPARSLWTKAQRPGLAPEDRGA